MNPLDVIIPIIWAGGLLASGLAVSKRLERRYYPDYFFPVVGLLGLIFFGLGLSGAFYKIIFIVLTLVFALGFVMILWIVRRGLIEYVKSWPLYLIVVLLPIMWYGLASLSYPVSTDALYFHLGLPRIYAAAGHVFYIPANLFSASPQTSEMISTGFYKLGLERGAPLFIMLVAAILILSVWRRAKDFGASGIIAVLILITIPIFMDQVVGSKNDYLLWGLSFFACVKFLQFDREGRLFFMVLAAIGAGMAAGTKAIGLALFGPFVLIMLYNTLLGKHKLSYIFFFTFIFIIFAFPWYLYSWIVTTNPVFPFYDEVFHSPYSSALFHAFNNNLAIKPVDRTLVNLIVSPIRLIFEPDAYDGRIGYGIILFPAMLIFVPNVRRILKNAIGISILFYLIWFIGFPFARFLLPVAPLLAIGGSYYFVRGLENRMLWRILAVLSLALGVALPLPAMIRDTLPRVKAVIENTPKYEFLEEYKILDPYRPRSADKVDGLPYIKCWKYINDTTPQNARIGILTSFWTRADGYYLDRDFVYLNPSEQNLFDFTKLGNDTAIDSALGALGINFIVLDSVVLEQYSENSGWADIKGFENLAAGVKALRDFCQKSGEKVYSDNRYNVFSRQVIHKLNADSLLNR